MVIPEQRPAVSVVIPARNAAETIVSQLDALDRQSFDLPFEVIVADNASNDGTREKVLSFTPHGWRLRYVVASRRASAAYARNVGASHALGERIAFCDADDEVGSRWLTALTAAADEPGVVAGGRIDESRLNDGTRREHFGSGDGLPIAWWFLRAASGGNLLVWKHDFDLLGGFDETLAYPTEDTDFSWRVQLAGFELRYAADAVVYYRHRSRASDAVSQGFRYGTGAARLLDRYRGVEGVPSGSPIGLRASMLAREFRRSQSARSPVPLLVQIAYEVGFSAGKAAFASAHLLRRNQSEKV